MFEKKKADCPFWRGPCKEHECRLYVKIEGKPPQSEEIISKWGCSFEFLPWLLVENSQRTREVGAAVESHRNEAVRRADMAMTHQLKIADHILENGGMPKLIENN